jgi:hypothetical protein
MGIGNEKKGKHEQSRISIQMRESLIFTFISFLKTNLKNGKMVNKTTGGEFGRKLERFTSGQNQGEK